MYRELFLKNPLEYFSQYIDRDKFYRFIPNQVFWDLYKEHKYEIKKEDVLVIKNERAKDGYYVVIYKKPRKSKNNLK